MRKPEDRWGEPSEQICSAFRLERGFQVLPSTTAEALFEQEAFRVGGVNPNGRRKEADNLVEALQQMEEEETHLMPSIPGKGIPSFQLFPKEFLRKSKLRAKVFFGKSSAPGTPVL